MSASRSKKIKGKAMVQFDSSEFVSENAQDQYFDSVLKRHSLAKRGLCVIGIDWPTITTNI